MTNEYAKALDKVKAAQEYFKTCDRGQYGVYLTKDEADIVSTALERAQKGEPYWEVRYRDSIKANTELTKKVDGLVEALRKVTRCGAVHARNIAEKALAEFGKHD